MVDLVYTHVDGSDCLWLAKKEKYYKSHYNPRINNTDSSSANRYRSRDELKYSLRSVDRYLPFIRKIFVVTDGQRPPWLQPSDKLQIIDHTDIIPSEYLPTFNSHVIEANLHKIPGLSETFLYLNDDMFFGRPLVESDFVNSEKISVFLDEAYTKKGKPRVNEYAFRSAWKNANAWLDKNFFIESRRKMAHAPSVIKKSVMKELEEKLSFQLSQTCTNKFRSIQDYNITCSLHPYYCIYTGQGIINEEISTKTLYLSDNLVNDTSCLDNLSISLPHIFCLEDDIKDTSPRIDTIINQFMENCFPTPSSFEVANIDN